MPSCEINFRYVNRDGMWPDFERHGLELLKDGTLQLPTLPRASTATARSPLPGPDAPAGVAVDWDDSIFYSDPTNHRVYKVDGCSGDAHPMSCLSSHGGLLGQLHTPRGLLIPAARRALYVADAGNHRVQVFNPVSGAVEGVLGASGLPHAPEPSDEPGRFNEPWALAADDDGAVYVVDYGNRRVQKFDAAGIVDPLFWERAAAEQVLQEPVDIAVVTDAGTPRVYVLDRGRRRVFQFDEHGRAVRLATGEPWAISERLEQAMGMAATSSALYVGDNAVGRVVQFTVGEPPALIGEAVGFSGRVAALTVDRRRGLLVHDGGGEVPVTLDLTAGRGRRGLLWGGPFVLDCPESEWRHVRALADVPSSGAHLEFFWLLSATATAPVVDIQSESPFQESAGWQSAGLDLIDFFVKGKRTHQLWIGARFTGNGASSAMLSQLRLQFDADSYLKLLPAIYQEASPCGDFLDRFLALFESGFDRTEARIRELPMFADVDAAPDHALPWLASWLGTELDASWDAETRREAIRHAYERYARRGTPLALRDAIWREAGVPVVIQEPMASAGWWRLPVPARQCDESSGPQWTDVEGSVLGWTTALVAAEPQGAVVGTTATLDRTHLTTDEEFAAPLFDDLAHQVQILMYPSFAGDHRTLARVRDIIEREKPAHVAYHLCVARPELRVGLQARIGIDAIVSGERTPTRLAESAGARTSLVLGGEPPGRVGLVNRLGVTTHL